MTIRKPGAIYTDIDFERGSDGIYDLAIDESTSDMALIDGLESAFLVSLFSDRRAAADEVIDPLRRRGWIGDTVSDVPDDRHGSGFWLYEQRKLIAETAIGLKNEGERALRWMVETGLVRDVSASIKSRPADRAVDLSISIGDVDGGTAIRTYALAENTRRRTLTNQSN